MTTKRRKGKRITRLEKIENNYEITPNVKYETKQYVIPNAEQKKLVQSIKDNSITLVSGNAGTGKTLFSIQTLFQLLKCNTINQILIIRLIIESEEEEIGALPGDDLQKLRPFLLPIIDNLERFLPIGEIKYLIAEERIKILPYSYIRGRSFHNKGIIVEESQNLRTNQIMTIATRIAEGTKIVFNGDDKQTDLHGRHGIEFLHDLFNDIEDIGIVKFKQKEIERHPIIAKLLERKELLENTRANSILNKSSSLTLNP